MLSRGRLIAYSVCHMAVDFACAFLLFSRAAPETWGGCFLLYNFLAFAMQLPLGLLCDRLNRNALCASCGCLLVAAAFVPGLPLAAACVPAGLGNALFHVGGGIDALNGSREKAWRLGVFVAPGALGIYFGARLSSQLSPWLPPLILLTAAVSILLCGKQGVFQSSGNAPLSLPEKSSPAALPLALCCLFFVVCLRSWAGLIVDFPWKQGAWPLLLALAAAGGKAAGGFLCDALGALRAAVCSLLLCAAFFLLSDLAVFGLFAVLLLNVSMPVTLFAAARLLPGVKGASFGLLTFALFIGYAVSSFFSINVSPYVYAGAATASALLLLPGLKRAAL